MSLSDMTPEELRAKYGINRGPGFGVQDSPTPQQAAATAEAEQHVHSMLDLRRACEEYNGPEFEPWLLWELPPPLRDRIDGVWARLREAKARDSREAPPGARKTCDSPGTIWYYDDRNKYDEANGWPAYDPDNPHHQTVPFGVIVGERDTVHVLRGGTAERVTPSSPKWHQSFGDEARELGLDDMPDYGHAYDFPTFMRHAERSQMFRVCDMRMPGGCKTGIGGGDTRLVAVPMGQWVYVLSMCESCIAALAKSQRRAHPNWRWPRWLFGGDRTSSRWRGARDGE
jgi:hypothetical protein